jgi:hypothetical protein
MPFRVLCAWLCAVVASAAAPAAAPVVPPGGIYAILAADTPAQYSLARKALHTPGVDGLLIHLRWAQISPTLMHYDWTALDNAVQLTKHTRKRFELGIVTGGAMPGWITEPPPQGLGAQSATFEVDPLGGSCTSLVMAPPYDPAYLEAFGDLLRQLSAHLHATGAYPRLSMLKLFGITTTTDELRLPALTECGADAVQTWLSLGYTQAKVESAWNTMLQDYLRYFPDKVFNIGFIGINAFPGIDPQGHAAKTAEAAERVSAQFAARLYQDAGLAMPGALALGFDSLTLNLPEGDASYPRSKHEFFADAAAAHARLGWQTNELLGEYPKGGAACGGSAPDNAVPCTDAAEFRRMLVRGLYPRHKANTPPEMQGVYLELFPQNIVDFAPAIAPAQQKLAVWNPE